MKLSKVRKAKGARAALAFANRSLVLHLLFVSTNFGVAYGFGDRDFAPLPLPSRSSPVVATFASAPRVLPDSQSADPVGGASDISTPIATVEVPSVPDAAHQIALRAAQHSGIANILAREHSAAKQHRNSAEVTESIRRQYIAALTVRARQTAAAQAKQLHYGIAAALEGLRISEQSLAFLEQQALAQQRLVAEGIPIPDPLLISRTITKVEDERLELLSKLQLMRIDLNGLIGAGGCDYAPEFIPAVAPSDIDVCERIEHSMQCRCDLITLVALRQTISKDTLEAWEHLAAAVSGVPATSVARKNIFLRLLTSSCTNAEVECAIASRRQWLDSVISERIRQISAEVEKAFEKKKTAALRWVKANEQVSLWETRINQLEKLGEVHSVMAELFSAQLNLLQARGDVVQRWLEWHQAETELELAIGCSRY